MTVFKTVMINFTEPLFIIFTLIFYKNLVLCNETYNFYSICRIDINSQDLIRILVQELVCKIAFVWIGNELSHFCGHVSL